MTVMIVSLLLQNYKETCKLITYECNSDIIFAVCGNGKSGSKHRYLQTALQNATLCYGVGSIENVWGTLACVALPPAEEYSPPSEEDSPESSSEYAYAPDGTQSGLCDYTASGVYQYVSYLDKSGLYAPDGVSYCHALHVHCPFSAMCNCSCYQQLTHPSTCAVILLSGMQLWVV